jgi:CDP-diacylglycerol--serine O-phosphatidyltransferase
MNQSLSVTSSPMGLKRHVPNVLTLCNVASGALGIVCAFEGHLVLAGYLIFIGAFFDFLDGFVARILKVQAELGKQLDSMADMVTFGVLPGIIAYKLIGILLASTAPGAADAYFWLPYIGLLIPVFSALRLAKFNLDTRQTMGFIGMPTPANAMLWAAMPLILFFQFGAGIETYIPLSSELVPAAFVLASLALVMSLLLVSEIPMFALKFKNFGWADNKIRFSFLGMAAILIVGGLLIKNVFISLPIIILLYLVISIVNNLISKGDEIQSGN